MPITRSKGRAGQSMTEELHTSSIEEQNDSENSDNNSEFSDDFNHSDIKDKEEASPSNSELSSKDFALPSLECLPSSDQRISAKLAITTLEDSVHILDSQAEETAIKLGRINNQRKTQMDRLLLFRAFLAPIRRLPMEVLGEIFLISVLELKKSPWDLAHVSKSFRVAAFVTRRLWANLRIVDNQSYRYRYFDGSEVCRNSKDLSRALERSKSAPLSIYINGCKEEMAKMLSKESKRWHSLSIGSEQDFVPSLFSNPVTTLEKITIRHGSITPFLSKIIRDSSSLCSIDMSCGGLCTLSSYSWTKRLIDISINLDFIESHEELSHASNSVLGILIETAHKLQTLSLTNIEMGSTSRLKTLKFLALKKLEVHSVENWWHFCSPTLLSLSIRVRCGNDSPPHGLKVTLPQLEELTFHSCHQFDHLESIDAPKLYSLLIEPVDSRPIRLGSCIPMFSPTKLSIKVGDIGYQDLLQFLQHFTKLRELELYEHSLPKSFFNAFKYKPRGPNSKLCPSLKVIRVSFSKLKGKQAEFVELFSDIIESRESSTSRRLTSFHCTWPKRLCLEGQELVEGVENT